MAKKPSLETLLSKFDAVDVPTSDKRTKKQNKLVSDFRKTVETFAIFFELGIRAAKVGVTAVEVFNCKPWELPTVGTVTPEQIQLFRSAVEKAEASL
jgi:hypothetical protein